MEIITGFICTLIGFTIGYFLQARKHNQELSLLASDSSVRIQILSRELAVVCTEQESPLAQEIILRVRLNKSAVEMAETNHPEMSPTEERAYEERIKNQFIP